MILSIHLRINDLTHLVIKNGYYNHQTNNLNKQVKRKKIDCHHDNQSP